MTRLTLGKLNTISIKDGLRIADCGLRTRLGIKRGLGIKHGLNIKCGLSLKIAVLTNKYQKNVSVFYSAFELSKTKSCFPGRLSFLSRSEWNANKRKHCKFKVRT